MNTETETESGMELDIKTTPVAEVIRKAETNYLSGVTTISKYVEFDMAEVIDTIEAYLNSKFTTGPQDSLGRDKPFFNIVVAAANIWQRATDIDRKDMKIRATKAKDYVNAFLATIKIQDWMRRENFGAFLNEWGRVLARYGSAIVEFIETDGKLHVSVWPWNRSIVDAVDFNSNPKIKILELTEAQLRQNESYDQSVVDSMIAAKTTRQTLDKRRKDAKSDYFKVYELHASLSLATLKKAQGNPLLEGDDKIFVEQMHVISFVGGTTKGGQQKKDNQAFTLFAGKKDKQTQMITHLIQEDGRTLSIGAVEHLFDVQWMQNHTAKAIKDHLDLASKLIFQTADNNFVGQNALLAIENGDILIHAPNMPLEQINNGSHDTVQLQNFGMMWKRQGNEIVGVSEAMLGASPKAGTAWRQTEALLTESHNLFEQMTENKGLYLEQMFREFIIPFIKKSLDTTEEIAATLEANDLTQIDGRYIKNLSRKLVNEKMKAMMIAGNLPSPEEQQAMLSATEKDISSQLEALGNQRFFSPGELGDKTWKEQLKDLEWDLEIDFTEEAQNVQDAMATLSTALKMVLTPGYSENKQAQMIVGKLLNLSGGMSPLEAQETQGLPTVPANLNSAPANPSVPQANPQAKGDNTNLGGLQ
jgi:hypothetical protein